MSARNNQIDPRSFWEETIKSWDSNRHGTNKNAMPFIYRLTHTPSEAVRFRKHVVLEHLASHVQDKRVIELGCGTGRLSQEIVGFGAKNYLGFDIAENAISLARERTAEYESNDRIAFERADMSEISSLDADFVFSTGLFPWLKTEQIEHLFSISRNIDFLHTSNERRFDIRQFLRFLHRHVTGTRKFQVTLRKASDIQAIAKRYGWQELYTFRHQNLRTLVCLSSLPFPDDLGPQEIIA